MEVYPSGFLPSPKVLYGLSSESTSKRMEMEAGNIRNRRLFSNVRGEVSLEFVYSNAQYDFWKGWYKHKIDNGADVFQMDLVLNEDLERFDVQIVNGDFNDRRISHEFRSVSLKILIEDTLIMGEAELDAILSP